MNWASIAAMAVLALTSAGLVFVFQWEPYMALATISIAALVLIQIGIVTLLAFARPCDRAALLRQIIETVREDFREMKTLLFKGGGDKYSSFYSYGDTTAHA